MGRVLPGCDPCGEVHPALHPTDPEFWFMMQVGMLLGFATAYPMTWWLLKKGLKEKM